MIVGVIRVPMPSWTVMSAGASACGVLGVLMPRGQGLAPVRTRVVMRMVHSVVGLQGRAMTAPPFRCVRHSVVVMVMPAAVVMFIMRIRIILGHQALVLF